MAMHSHADPGNETKLDFSTMNASTLIAIREAQPADAPGIVELCFEVQTIHAKARPDLFRPDGRESVEELIERMDAPDHFLWVAECGGGLVGCAIARLNDKPQNRWCYASRELSLEHIGVTPNHQRKGVGRLLWEAVRQTAADEGVQRVTLSVWSFNTSARDFYTQAGFVPLLERLSLELDAE